MPSSIYTNSQALFKYNEIYHYMKKEYESYDFSKVYENDFRLYATKTNKLKENYSLKRYV